MRKRYLIAATLLQNATDCLGNEHTADCTGHASDADHRCHSVRREKIGAHRKQIG
jgi:hypothetical protein